MRDELKPCDDHWRAVPGFPHYEVSRVGTVRCWIAGGGQRRRQPREKVAQTDKDGYPFVLLYSQGRSKGYRISRLVLLTFAPDARCDGAEASHIDGDKSNNKLSNLIWESRFDNEQRKRAHGTRPTGSRNAAAKLTDDSVREMRQRRAGGESLSSLSEAFGVSESNISQICRGRIWKSV